MKTSFVLSLVLAASIATPSLAQSRFQVVRATDSEMTCEAMSEEINDLSAQTQQQLQRAQRGAARQQTAGRVGRGLLSGLARSATMFAYGGSSGESIAQAAAGSAVSGVANEMMTPGSPAPAPAVDQPDTPQLQRLNRLREMHVARPC